MILADTSVWIDHFRRADAGLADCLMQGLITTHPFVIGELALGGLHRRDEILNLLQALPRTMVAADDEVLTFITRAALAGRGIGYVDCHLLAAVRLTPGCRLWTRDRRLDAIAREMALTAGLA